MLLNSFASDSLKKEEEESRLGLAFAKLKRYFLIVICICCCCLPKRYRNKVSDSSENVKVETPVENAKEATENNVIARTDAFVVVSNDDVEHVPDKGLTNGGFEKHGTTCIFMSFDFLIELYTLSWIRTLFDKYLLYVPKFLLKFLE